MSTLNLGIVAHVDAGKTTLTERLLFETGVSSHLGRVDHGDTVTDADAIERRRGITIRSAVVTFTLGDLKVNLIDTPGHADFVAEVERALAVLDGAVLVVSAVEGVQAQTRALIRIMERLERPVPRVRQQDRPQRCVRRRHPGRAPGGARRRRGRPQPTDGARQQVGGRPSAARRRARRRAARSPLPVRRRRAAHRVEGPDPLTEDELRSALARSTAAGDTHPVLFGAALHGVGVRDLLDALPAFLPAATGSAERPVHASVFKMEVDAGGHPVAFARLHDGRLSSRDPVTRHRRLPDGTVTVVDTRATRVSTFTVGADADRRAGRRRRHRHGRRVDRRGDR